MLNRMIFRSAISMLTLALSGGVAFADAPDTLWSYMYGDSLLEHDPRAFIQSSDGGYVMTGYESPYRGRGDIVLTKTDAQGNEQWKRKWGAWLSSIFPRAVLN